MRPCLVGQDQVGTASHSLQNQMTGTLSPISLVVSNSISTIRSMDGCRRAMTRAPDRYFRRSIQNIGRVGRVLPAAFGELEPGMGGVGGEQQLAVALIAPEEHHNFIPSRLKDLIHTAPSTAGRHSWTIPVKQAASNGISSPLLFFHDDTEQLVDAFQLSL